MIYTVTFNPSLDYVVNVPDFETGKVNRTTGETIFPGGKGINVSIVLNNLGIDNKALGFTAGFTGDALITLLKERGVSSDFIKIDEGMTRINVKLRSDEETEINGQGPVITEQHIGDLYEKLDYLDEDDYLVLAGSIPKSMPRTAYKDIMQRLYEKNIKIIVDATNELLLNALSYKPFLVKPNIHELGDVFGVTINDKDDVVKYGRKLMDMGAKNVLVSMAGDGAILLAEDGNVYHTAAPEGEVKNSVGAGDSMVAGFIAGYIDKKNYEDAFKMGVCTGSASAFSEELATKEEVLELLNNWK